MLTKKQIQEIIDEEITVDCYGDHEIHSSWAIYMTENLNFPFEASYSAKKISGESEWQKVKVVANYTNEDDFNMQNFFVEIEFNDFLIPVDLDDLKDIEADEETMEAVQVWSARNDY